MADQPRACVYTSLIGDYEKLNEQPISALSSLPFICLTDHTGLQSDTWRIVRVDPLFPPDPVRSQRMFKLLPHRFLPDFELSLYIDNSVLLTKTPEEIFDRYVASAEFVLPMHSYRDRVIDEFIEVAKLALDDPERISEQLDHYRLSDPAALDERPYWGAIQMRRHNSPDVRRALETWASHVLRYSRRDQLAANAAFRLAKWKPLGIEIDNYASWFHTWPHAAERLTRPVKSPGILLQEKINVLQDELALARTQIQQHVVVMDAMRSSWSWRLTSPLRSLGRQWSRWTG